MQVMFIAIGNTLRRDDGAAHRVLELLGPLPNAVTRSCLQLTPEMAEEIAPAAAVVFIDADVEPGLPRLEPLALMASSAVSLTHSVTLSDLVALSRKLYSFQGTAYVCLVPGTNFSEGEGLTPGAESNARRAAELLRSLSFWPDPTAPVNTESP